MYSGEALRRMSSGARNPMAVNADIRQRTVLPGENTGCGDSTGSKWGLRDHPLAMVYAPLQNFTGLYEPEKGLCRGTIFSELDLPLLSVGVKGGGMVRNG